MNDPLAMLLAGASERATAFPPTSRYHGLDLARMTLPNGRNVVYVRRRFLPKSTELALIEEQKVRDGERADLVAARVLGDPEQWWRICDANNVLHPDEVSEPGRILRITLPQGVPGGPRV
jgi:hypothetical protein